MTDPVGVGVIGAGNISADYLTNLTAFPDLDVRMVADLDVARAENRAREFGVPAHGPVDRLLADDRIDVVVNLTVPAAHVEVGRRVIAAGKHLWNEKPIGLSHDTAALLLDEADRAGVRVGVAPDTVLGAGLQTAFRAVADGLVGRPLTASTTMIGPGPDAWHPDPEFLFAPGAGPLFDMGPYYLTTLLTVFGAVRRVAATSSTARRERVIGDGPRAGTTFPVGVPTHTALLLSFAGGTSAQSVFSFQSALGRTGIEITGTEGVLVLPDPNGFDGPSLLWRDGAQEPDEISAVGVTAGRGLGVLEMARAIRAGTPHRADGRLAAHVLDVLEAGLAATDATYVDITSTVERPPLLAADFDPYARSL